MNLFSWLHRLLPDTSDAGKSYLFVDEDAESLTGMALLIRKR